MTESETDEQLLGPSAEIAAFPSAPERSSPRERIEAECDEPGREEDAAFGGTPEAEVPSAIDPEPVRPTLFVPPDLRANPRGRPRTPSPDPFPPAVLPESGERPPSEPPTPEASSPSSPRTLAKGLLPHLPDLDEMAPRRAPQAVDLERPTPETAGPADVGSSDEITPLPAGPPRWRTGIAAVGAAFEHGARTLPAALRRAWSAYSLFCARLQALLSRLTGRAVNHGGRAAVAAGRLSTAASRRSARLAGRALVGVGAAVRRGVACAAPLAKRALTSAGTATARLGKSAAAKAGQGAALSAQAARGSGAALGRGAIRTAGEVRGTLRKAVDALEARRREREARPAPSARTAGASSAVVPEVNGKSSLPEVPPPSVAKDRKAVATVAAMSAVSGSTFSFFKPLASRLRTLPRPEPLTASLAVAALASIALFVSTLLSVLATDGTTATLTVAIPDRPATPASDPDPAGRAAVDAGADAARRGSDLVGTLPPAPSDDGPLADIVAHIASRQTAAASSQRAVSLVATAEAIDGLSQFALAAKVVGLDKLLKPGEPYTVFAPSDAAFAALGTDRMEALLEPAGHERLLALLNHHILQGRVTSDDLDADGREYASMADAALTVDAASLIDADHPTANGVLHVIDEVLAVPGG